MKRIIIAGLLFATSVPMAFADHGYDSKPFFNKENVGRAVGAGVGALLGSRIGGGRGKTAATAAAAVGGYILGGKIGRDWQPRHTNRSYSGQRISRSNPTPQVKRHSYKAPVQVMPALTEIHAPYTASRASNIRGGPGMAYVVVEQLLPGETVSVVGHVVDSDWYMIASNDIIRGFVHTSLLRPSVTQYTQSSSSLLGQTVSQNYQ